MELRDSTAAEEALRGLHGVALHGHRVALQPGAPRLTGLGDVLVKGLAPGDSGALLLAMLEKTFKARLRPAPTFLQKAFFPVEQMNMKKRLSFRGAACET